MGVLTHAAPPRRAQVCFVATLVCAPMDDILAASHQVRPEAGLRWTVRGPETPQP